MGETEFEGQQPPAEGEAVEEAPWQGPSQEEWSATQEALQALTPLAQAWAQEQEQRQQQPLEDDWDPFDPEAIDRRIDQRTARYQQWMEQQDMEEAEARAEDIIADIASREGEFLYPDQSPQVVRDVANRYMAPMVEKYGRTPKAAEAALMQAYKDVRAYEDHVGQAYHERQMNQLQNLGRVRREPPGNQQGNEGLVTPEGGNEMDLVRSFFSRSTGA